MTSDEEEIRAWLDSDDPTEARHARLRLARAEADGFFRPASRPASRPSNDLPPRSAKPRMSFDQLADARRDCVPCQEEEDTWGAATLAFRGYLTSHTGYGQISEHLGRGLDREGVTFRFHDLEANRLEFLPRNPWVGERTAQTPPPRDKPVLQLSTPWTGTWNGHPTVFFSMWESSRLSDLFVHNLNGALAVVVPCRWNADGFKASGVTVPVHVVPLGVDPAEGYTPKPWPEGQPFTFGMAARMTHGGVRKGINEGMAAFVRAFDQGEDVRLSVKVYPDCIPLLKTPDDPRIEVITDPMTPPEMAAWHERIDCLFVPSKGEGWGLHTLQAMACGRPVIASVYGGTAEFFDGRFGWELPYTEEPAGEFYKGLGDWAVPTEPGMVEALRAACRDPDACRRKGARAAERAREFPWGRTGAELVKVLRSAGLVPEIAVDQSS